jgi:hypothetical protein
MMKLHTRKFNMETAFLYSDLDEEIYMQIPDVHVRYMKKIHNKVIDPKTHVLLLKKAIYGLVQAARLCWKKLRESHGRMQFLPKQSRSLSLYEEGKS